VRGRQVVVPSSGTESGMIIGDTVHSSAQIDEPEMVFKFDNDPATANQRRDRILAEAAAASMIIGAPHFAPSASAGFPVIDRSSTPLSCMDARPRTHPRSTPGPSGRTGAGDSPPYRKEGREAGA
jgi:hypothetical protein